MTLLGKPLPLLVSGRPSILSVYFIVRLFYTLFYNREAWFHGATSAPSGGTPSQTISGSGAGNQPSPTPSAVIANNLTRGLALAPVTSHRVSGEPPPLSSGEPLALRAPAWSMKHMPPTASPIRPDGVLANHVGKPVISADHSPISRPDKPSAVPGVQPLDAVALRSRSTLVVRRPVEGSRPAPAPSNS